MSDSGLRATPSAPERSSLCEARRRRWTIRRRFVMEPWRIVAMLRVFRGNGLANFEFVFKFGFPRHSRNAARQIEEMLSVDVEDAV